MNDFGISLYLGTGLQKNAEIVEKAHRAEIRYAFTSLHIPEEDPNCVKDIRALLELCKEYQISLIADIGPRTLQKMGFQNISDLKQTAITHLRVDYGFSCAEMVEFSKDFHIVFNASTLQDSQISELQSLHADFSRFSACHNFYPKPLTGLSLERVRKMNERIHRLGMRTMAFVAGDSTLRGPLKMGLPTAEAHRTGDVLLNMLQLIKLCETDTCLIGDIGASEQAYRRIRELADGYVSLQAELAPAYAYIADSIHHDRPDSSDYVIRSQESRAYASAGRQFSVEPCQPRPRGSISVGNEKYLRYSGELEIARQDLQPESRVNIIGQVKPESMPYLDYITDGLGFKLVL